MNFKCFKNVWACYIPNEWLSLGRGEDKVLDTGEVVQWVSAVTNL